MCTAHVCDAWPVPRAIVMSSHALGRCGKGVCTQRRSKIFDVTRTDAISRESSAKRSAGNAASADHSGKIRIPKRYTYSNSSSSLGLLEGSLEVLSFDLNDSRRTRPQSTHFTQLICITKAIHIRGSPASVRGLRACHVICLPPVNLSVVLVMSANLTMTTTTIRSCCRRRPLAASCCRHRCR